MIGEVPYPRAVEAVFAKQRQLRLRLIVAVGPDGCKHQLDSELAMELLIATNGGVMFVFTEQ